MRLKEAEEERRLNGHREVVIHQRPQYEQYTHV